MARVVPSNADWKRVAAATDKVLGSATDLTRARLRKRIAGSGGGVTMKYAKVVAHIGNGIYTVKVYSSGYLKDDGSEGEYTTKRAELLNVSMSDPLKPDQRVMVFSSTLSVIE